MNYWLILVPIISAFIGWIINRLAIKMLFHPRKSKKILGITFQGILPKRQPEISEKIGKLVSQQFLSLLDIEQKISNPENLKSVMPMIEDHVDDFLRIKLKNEMPVVSMFIGDKTITSLKTVFMQEIEILFPQVIKQFAGNLINEQDLEKILVQKLNSFSSEKLETIICQSLSKEFRLIEMIGAIAGFIIGLAQILILWLTS
jgi:uncharacterized membrane protein YheB (UPF0754 family)